MQYPQLAYIPDEDDPSLTIETEQLVAKIIDNTGLMLEEQEGVKSYFLRYAGNSFIPFSHHMGYHGIRALHAKDEKRNVVMPLASWLNLQAVRLTGIENDPVDERASSGVARGWPIRMERSGAGVKLILDPLPQTQFSYTIDFQPCEPDGIDFAIRFVFEKRPNEGPVSFWGSWPCYISAYDDVRFFYPRDNGQSAWTWDRLCEKPDIVLGEPVGYEHVQDYAQVTNQALPLGFGRIGERALVLMFDDPHVSFFTVNTGGHSAISPVQNPAWDFGWTLDDYPLNEPVGFNGRLLYTPFRGEDDVLRRYEQWIKVKAPDDA